MELLIVDTDLFEEIPALPEDWGLNLDHLPVRELPCKTPHVHIHPIFSCNKCIQLGLKE